MQDRSINFDERRGGQPQPIGQILAELLAQYQGRFGEAGIAVVPTPAVMEDQPCSCYPAEMASAS
jgi:hypothetical protein